MEADTAPELPQDAASVRDGRAALHASPSSLIARTVEGLRPGSRGAGGVSAGGGVGRDATAGGNAGARTTAGGAAGARTTAGGGAGAPFARVVAGSWPPGPLTAAIAVVAVAVGFVVGLSYYSAREFSGRAAETRASNEAQSFAAHSSRLANGDAFSGYVQILRYAEDPVVAGKYSPANDRANALQQLLYLNTNKFESLTIADRTGIIFATTDARISTLKDSGTLAETRANLLPANSDIVLPEAGEHGYVEYTAPLRDVDGSIWGILVGRVDPAVLWRETLIATVDGGQNVIINNSGQFAAGVPDELLRLPWQGVPLGNGAVRATIAGVDSICGLAPIGRDTQIDRGLNVASCLPASIIQAERSGATGKQALITLTGAVLAIAAAAAVLRIVLRRALASAPQALMTDMPSAAEMRIATVSAESAPTTAVDEETETPDVGEPESEPASEPEPALPRRILTPLP